MIIKKLKENSAQAEWNWYMQANEYSHGAEIQRKSDNYESILILKWLPYLVPAKWHEHVAISVSLKAHPDTESVAYIHSSKPL